jgi:hypothetical protein
MVVSPSFLVWLVMVVLPGRYAPGARQIGGETPSSDRL